MDNRTYMGIDPGKSGALCIWYKANSSFDPEDYFDFFDFIDWPKDDNPATLICQLNKYAYDTGLCQSNEQAHGGRENFAELVARENPFCVIEKVSSKNFGMWLMLLSILKIRHQILTPTAWRKNLITKTDGPDAKKAAYTVACRLFPEMISELQKSKGDVKDGRVNALLMAHKACLIETGIEKKCAQLLLTFQKLKKIPKWIE